MTLTLSLNSLTMTVGLYEGERRQVFRVSVHRRMTPDEFYLQLSQLTILSGGGPPTGAIIASVTPRLTLVAAQAVEKLCGTRPYIIGPGIKSGVDIKINDPSELGADLVAMAAGLAEKYPLPAILVNISEATTLSYIDRQGRYLGTVICAGVGPSLQSLVDNAELLNPVPLAAPARALGACTEDSIRSGLIYGTAGMLDTLIARIRAEHPCDTVVATGGETALAVLPHCGVSMEYDAHLLTDGMYHIYRRQAGHGHRKGS